MNKIVTFSQHIDVVNYIFTSNTITRRSKFPNTLLHLSIHLHTKTNRVFGPLFKLLSCVLKFFTRMSSSAFLSVDTLTRLETRALESTLQLVGSVSEETSAKAF